MQTISETLARWAIALWRGGEVAERVIWDLSRLPGLQVRREGQELFIRGQGQAGILIGRGDPVTIAVCLGFALFGLAWPEVADSMLELVNKEWKKSVSRSSRSRRAGGERGREICEGNL